MPPNVLSQLGNRIHHVIRAFTPNDVKALKETVKSFPHSSYYDIEKQFTQLGTGQAFVTVLNEKGIPTETVVTHLAPPASVMGPLTESEYQAQLANSEMYRKYKDTIDPESAYEILNERVQAIREEQTSQETVTQTARQSGRKEKSMVEEVMSSSMGRQIGRELVRGVFGMLFGSAPKRSYRKRRR